MEWGGAQSVAPEKKCYIIKRADYWCLAVIYLLDH